MLPEYGPDEISVAAGAVLTALLTLLIDKGVISGAEAGTVLADARTAIGRRTHSDMVDRAIKLLSAVADRLPKNNV